MKPYYRILRLNHGRAPTIQHATLEEASAEALRLAGQHPGETFEILKVLGIARTTEPSIFWNDWCAPSAEDTLPPTEPEPTSVRYPTTPLPEGFDRWECRGFGWAPGRPTRYTFWDSDDGLWFSGDADKLETPTGYSGMEYWEAVKDEPGYRMLESGELIIEGDEYMFWVDGWASSCNAGLKVHTLDYGRYRRLVTPTNPQQ